MFIICSPKELSVLNGLSEFNGLLKITPGIRPIWAAIGDQKRIMTPVEAIKAGATALAIGRPITSPPLAIGSPIDAVVNITGEIASALAFEG